MAIAFDAVANSGAKFGNTSYSYTHVCTGSNLYLIVGVAFSDSFGPTISSITYNSVALTKLKEETVVFGLVSSIWGLAAPTSGSNSVTVTFSGSASSRSTSVSYTGVKQTSTTDGTGGANGSGPPGGGGTVTVDVTTSVDNDIVVDCVSTSDTGLTVGAGQTERANQTGGGVPSLMFSDEPKATAGTVTMSWDGVDELLAWSTAAVGLKQADAVTLTGPPFIHNRAVNRSNNY